MGGGKLGPSLRCGMTGRGSSPEVEKQVPCEDDKRKARAPSVSRSLLLEVGEGFGSVDVAGVELEGFFVAGDGLRFVAGVAVGFAEAVVGVPTGGVEADDELEDGEGLRDVAAL